MSSTPSKEKTTLKTEIQRFNMSYDEYTRWLCLLEGIELVGKREEQLKRRTGVNDIDWIKPLAFQKYIDERFLSMKSDLDEIEQNNATTAPNIPCTISLVPALA